MTGHQDSNRQPLDVRRRRLQFRAWHRGMREVDLLLGRFADATIAELDDVELSGFEALLEVPDREILAWVTGESAVPADAQSALVERLLSFHGTQPSAQA